MLKEMIEYQKKDNELVMIERELENSSIKKIVANMQDVVREAQRKLLACEKSAEMLMGDYNKQKAEYDRAVEGLDEVSRVKVEEKDAEALKKISADATGVNSSFLFLEKNLSNLSKQISDLLDAFESTKQQGMDAKRKLTAGSEAYSEMIKAKEPQIEALKLQLAELESKLNAELLRHYKKLRDDKIFPVFVPLLDRSCGGCSMELPSSKIDIIKRDNKLECENCRRIIYMNV